MSYIGNPIISTDFPKDKFSGNGSTTAFTMSIAPASVNSVLVIVSGITQSPDTYTISGTTLTFSAAPPTGTDNILVRHLGVAGISNTPSDASVTSAKLAPLTTLPVKGGYTATLPAATGTVMVSGNMPAFSAYQSSSQTPSAATFTKCQLQTEEFDTANCFDSTTNYRFTPNVAGYYQVSGACSFGGAANTKQVAIYKNGSTYKQGSDASQTECTVSCLVYLNGSTDYIEFYIYTSTSVATDNLANRTYFQAAMVRRAP